MMALPMHVTMTAAETAITSLLDRRGHADAAAIAWATVWLEACAYPGCGLLAEALAEDMSVPTLERDALGLDLKNASCAFLAPAIMRDVAANGRVFLRNARHGLFLLPFTVKANIGIGCPVDPAFAVGGERHKNPYAEKLAVAEARGLEIEEMYWKACTCSGTN